MISDHELELVGVEIIDNKADAEKARRKDLQINYLKSNSVKG